MLIIVTDAQVFETKKKYGGQGYLAAPYYLTCCDALKCLRNGGNWLEREKTSKNNDQPGTGKIYRG